METLLQVHDLTVSYRRGDTETCALAGATFQIDAGETVGLLGESGCGKSTTALALLRLLPGNGRVAQGVVHFRGRDLLGLDSREMEQIRGAEIALIFQEPSIALNPVMRAGEQVVEVIRAHRGWSRRRCRSRAEDLLAAVRLDDVERVYGSFPHELSGGQKRRILIAQALACDPALVIADEPTTGLDSRTQMEILDLFRDLKAQSRTAFLFISHDPEVFAGLADRLMVMYAGRIVEQGGLHHVCRTPLHPYTRGLLDSMPRTSEGALDLQRLHPIPGSPPDMSSLPRGCPFAPRCSERLSLCESEEPSDAGWNGGRTVRCHARIGVERR